jgi:hypothetical protein
MPISIGTQRPVDILISDIDQTTQRVTIPMSVSNQLISYTLLEILQPSGFHANRTVPACLLWNIH